MHFNNNLMAAVKNYNKTLFPEGKKINIISSSSFNHNTSPLPPFLNAWPCAYFICLIAFFVLFNLINVVDIVVIIVCFICVFIRKIIRKSLAC